MMSQQKLEEIVAKAIVEGRNAVQVAQSTGVPPERVQLVMHRLRGRDPGKANRDTRKRRSEEDAAIFGNHVSSRVAAPHLPSARGRGAHGRGA